MSVEMKAGVAYPSFTERINSPCGKFYVTSVLSPDFSELLRVFIHAGKAGGCASAHLTALSNRINAEIDRGSRESLMKAFSEMTGIRCHMPECCVSQVAHRLMAEEIRRYDAEDD